MELFNELRARARANRDKIISRAKEEYAASIAIIGKSGRFPGAGNLIQFWRNLCAGTESISFFTRCQPSRSRLK